MNEAGASIDFTGEEKDKNIKPILMENQWHEKAWFCGKCKAKLRYLTDPKEIGNKCPKCGTVYWKDE